MSRSGFAVLGATVAVLVASVAIPPMSASAAPEPSPYTEAELTEDHPSDEDPGLLPMLEGFSALETEHPEALTANSDIAVRINTSATRTEQLRAMDDAVNDMSVTMADGLGQRLGSLYLAARDDGDLPRTTELISRSTDLVAPPWTSIDKAKGHFGYIRPFIAMPDRIVKHQDLTGKIYEVAKYSFPSGHTEQASVQGLVLATLLPELAPQILARASEAGNNRIVLGVHYPLDVIGGRMVGTRMVVARWHDSTFRPLLEQARTELRAVLEERCGDDLPSCISDDTPYLPTDEALRVYTERLTYGLPRVGTAGLAPEIPPGAEDLLLTAFPNLSAEQRRELLELTALDSGYPLDLSGSGEGAETAGWQRLNVAAALAAEPVVADDGTVTLPQEDTSSPAATAGSGDGPQAHAEAWAGRHLLVLGGSVLLLFLVVISVLVVRARRRGRVPA